MEFPKFLIEKIFTILSGSIGILLAFWVYFADRKAKLNKVFFAMTFFLVLWLILVHLLYGAQTPEQALLLKRAILGVITLWLIPAYYFFVVYFPHESVKRNYALDKILVLILSVFSFLVFSTPLVIKNINGVYFKVGSPEFNLGSMSLIYYGTVLLLVMFFIYSLFKKYLKLFREDKLKVQYVLIGSLLFGFINICFNLVLPLIGMNNAYTKIGAYSTIVFLGFVAYAIVKRQLFSIKVMMTHLLVIVMGLVLFIVPFFVNPSWLKALLFSIFGLFCVFGYLFIRYTLREAKQKEILEQKVQERTKELEKSKNIAEDRAKEIERWYHLTVGRELRMAELKEKMKKIEESHKK